MAQACDFLGKTAFVGLAGGLLVDGVAGEEVLEVALVGVLTEVLVVLDASGFLEEVRDVLFLLAGLASSDRRVAVGRLHGLPGTLVLDVLDLASRGLAFLLGLLAEEACTVIQLGVEFFGLLLFIC